MCHLDWRAEAAENPSVTCCKDRLAIASQAVEELEETDPDDRELVLYRQGAAGSGGGLKNHARADILFFFDLETAEMRRAELIEAPTGRRHVEQGNTGRGRQCGVSAS